MKWLLALLFVGPAWLAGAQGDARFASIFSDNMVLQQQTEVNLWGFAKPDEQLLLRCSWLDAALPLRSKADGSWAASVKTPHGSLQPCSVSLTDSKGRTTTLTNVLIGEVWLCSGQSNMEMILMDRPEWNLLVEGSEEEIARADNPLIRFVNLQRKESFTPQTEVLSHNWRLCTPNEVKWLSAVAYFFGKKLTAGLQVPVGLIVSSYGGSPVQSWIPSEIIDAESRYHSVKKERDAERKASLQSPAEYLKAMSDWIARAEQKSSPNGKEEILPIMLPVNFEKSPMGNQMGEVLLSRAIDLGPSAPGHDLKISLGTMDDLGRVYFNGELVWEEIRNSSSYAQVQFTIPAEKIKPGINHLEVRVLNILWGGGLTGPVENMYYTFGENAPKISLAGEWQFQKIFDLAEADPLPREGKPLFSTASSLYNGMIAPLTGYTLRGCLWYQGESNVGEEKTYPQMMADLVNSWRKAFGREFPFYYVQIAPYQYGGNQHTKAAEFREAQANVVTMVPKTGMVVTMDIGDPDNIHPAQKREVGFRLANLALAETYGTAVRHKFPKVTNVKRRQNRLVLSFANVYEGLTLRGDRHEFELSADGETFYPAAINKISSGTIQVSSSQVRLPRYVRYCWGDASCSTIFNAENLPLSSFRAEATP